MEKIAAIDPGKSPINAGLMFVVTGTIFRKFTDIIWTH